MSLAEESHEATEAVKYLRVLNASLCNVAEGDWRGMRAALPPLAKDIALVHTSSRYYAQRARLLDLLQKVRVCGHGWGRRVGGGGVEGRGMEVDGLFSFQQGLSCRMRGRLGAGCLRWMKDSWLTRCAGGSAPHHPQPGAHCGGQPERVGLAAPLGCGAAEGCAGLACGVCGACMGEARRERMEGWGHRVHFNCSSCVPGWVGLAVCLCTNTMINGDSLSA